MVTHWLKSWSSARLFAERVDWRWGIFALRGSHSGSWQSSDMQNDDSSFRDKRGDWSCPDNRGCRLGIGEHGNSGESHDSVGCSDIRGLMFPKNFLLPCTSGMAFKWGRNSERLVVFLDLDDPFRQFRDTCMCPLWSCAAFAEDAWSWGRISCFAMFRLV